MFLQGNMGISDSLVKRSRIQEWGKTNMKINISRGHSENGNNNAVDISYKMRLNLDLGSKQHINYHKE